MQDSVAWARHDVEAHDQHDRPKLAQLVAILGGHPLEDSASWFGLQSRATAGAVARLQRQHDALSMRPGRIAVQHRARIGQQVYDARRVLRAYQEAKVEAQVADGVPNDQLTPVTATSLDELAAEQDRGRRTVRTVLGMPKRQRQRFDGMTLAAIRRHPGYIAAQRRERSITVHGGIRRTNASSGRPRARPTRQTTRAGAQSGDSGDDGPESEPPPPRLRVARRRTPLGYALSRCPRCGRVLLFSDGRLICANRCCSDWGRPC
jgi:hypothetical protein